MPSVLISGFHVEIDPAEKNLTSIRIFLQHAPADFYSKISCEGMSRM
jgi:hypothetical protein